MIVVRDAVNGCVCACGNPPYSDFNYQNFTLYLYGDEDQDIIVGGSGHNVIDGGSSDDWLRAGTNDDQISGGTGADIVYDLGGDHDVLHGDDGQDCIEDLGCEWATCEGDAHPMNQGDETACEDCAECEVFPAECIVECPAF